MNAYDAEIKMNQPATEIIVDQVDTPILRGRNGGDFGISQPSPVAEGAPLLEHARGDSRKLRIQRYRLSISFVRLCTTGEVRRSRGGLNGSSVQETPAEIGEGSPNGASGSCRNYIHVSARWRFSRSR